MVLPPEDGTPTGLDTFRHTSQEDWDRMTRIVPGQLWRWDFDVLGTWMWPLEIVTEERRHSVGVGSHTLLFKNNVFTIIAIDDEGPFDDFQSSYELRPVGPYEVRWHVILVNDVLAWFDHSNFVVSSLIQDVP